MTRLGLLRTDRSLAPRRQGPLLFSWPQSHLASAFSCPQPVRRPIHSSQFPEPLPLLSHPIVHLHHRPPSALGRPPLLWPTSNVARSSGPSARPRWLAPRACRLLPPAVAVYAVVGAVSERCQ